MKTDIDTLASKPAAAAARKPESHDAQAAEVNLESARQEVKVPAIGLMVLGVLPCLMATALMLFGAGTVYPAFGSRDKHEADDGPLSARSRPTGAPTFEPAAPYLGQPYAAKRGT